MYRIMIFNKLILVNLKQIQQCNENQLLSIKQHIQNNLYESEIFYVPHKSMKFTVLE